jgi:hypothetical protein
MFLLHTALFIGQIILAIVFWILVQNKKEFEADASFERILQSVVVIIAGICILGSNIVFKKKIEAIKASTENVDVKIQQYVTNALVKFTIIECPAVLSLIAYYLTGNLSFFLFGIAILIYFAIQKPGIDGISYHLGISRDDLIQSETKI